MRYHMTISVIPSQTFSCLCSMNRRDVVSDSYQRMVKSYGYIIYNCQVSFSPIFYPFHILFVYGTICQQFYQRIPLCIVSFNKTCMYIKVWFGLICGDLGINRYLIKNSQPDIDSSAARYKMYKCVATHKAPRIHPVKIRKKKNNKM